MKKKIILAIILVVVLLGAGFAYAYFATDAFKTDKELFFKYVGSDILENFADEDLTKYNEKFLNTSSSYEGEAKITTNMPETLETNTANEIKVDIDGKNDRVRNRTEMTMDFDFSAGVVIPISLKVEEDTIGIQINLLDSKYIAVKNENLKDLAEKFGIDPTTIPDKIEFSSNEFTDEEVNSLKEKYKAFFDENLTDELFTQEKVDNTKTVKLEMTADRFIDILTKLMQTLRDDEIILGKIADKDSYQKSIDAQIEELQKIETTDTDKFVMNLYIKNKTVEKYEVLLKEENETIMTVDIEKTDGKLSIKIYEYDELLGEMTLSKTKTESDLSYDISMKLYDEGETVELALSLKYGNLVALDNVTESLEFTLSSNDSTITSGINVTVTFDPTVEVEELNEDNATILNDATDEELQMLIYRIYQNLGLI